MNRVHGPYAHHGRWRLMIVDEDGTQTAERYETEDEALTALAVHNESLRAEALATVLAKTAVVVPELPTWVYFLHDAIGDIIYVGVSAALNHRLQEHRDAKEAFVSASCLPTPLARQEALRLEASLVRELRPRLNIRLQLAGNF